MDLNDLEELGPEQALRKVARKKAELLQELHLLDKLLVKFSLKCAGLRSRVKPLTNTKLILNACVEWRPRSFIAATTNIKKDTISASLAMLTKRGVLEKRTRVTDRKYEWRVKRNGNAPTTV